MKNKGFTLVEILITIALIGILSAMAALTIPGMMDSYKVRGSARQLYSDMQMARLRAIKEGKQWAVEFTDSTTYCVKSEVNTATNLADGWTDGCTTANDTIIKTVTLASDYSGVSATSSPTGRVQFNPNGTAGGTNPVTFSKGSRTQSICLTTGTGRIRIC